MVTAKVRAIARHYVSDHCLCRLSTNNYNTDTQDDIYSAVYTAPAICKSSLWVIWMKVGQHQVDGKSQAKLQT